MPGRLVFKSKYQTPASAPDKRTYPYDSRTRLCDKLRKIRARTYTKNRLSGLPFRFDTGKSLSNRKEVENSRKVCSGHGDRITNNPKAAYVPDMRTFQWYLKTNWQYPQSLDLKIPVSNLLKKHLQWWKDPKNLKMGCPLHPQEHNTLIFTDASNQGWGAHLENMSVTVSGNWTDQEKLLHINVLELKAVFLALKAF